MITFVESPDSPTSSEKPRSCTRHYRLAGIFDHLTAKGYAIQSLAAIYDSLFLQDVKLDSDGFNIWKVDASYGIPSISGQSEVKDGVHYGLLDWGWDNTGATKKMTQALQHIQSYARPTLTAPDHKGAIGVHGSGGELEVEGVEWPTRSFKWWEKWQLPRAYATMGYSIVCEALYATVNAAVFRGRARGTVRFDGAQASGSTKTPDIVEATYHFAGSPNLVGQTIGTITGVAKEGWQYQWIEYQSEQDAVAKKNVKQPLAVHVERVAEYGDFSFLGIGTGLF
jgi:hypothetical protein